jgi:hypothetical protein
MSSSLPVPSKAALTALRGLVVGTSCTLAIVAEDRRRKINNAVRAIENGEKIKSARKYRAGGGALALAIEEDAIWDSGLGLASMPRGGVGLHPYNPKDNGGMLLNPGRKSKNQRGQLGGQDGGENMAGPLDVGLTNGERGWASEHSDIGNSNNAGSLGQPGRPGTLLKTRNPAVMPPLPKLAASPNPGPSWMFENTETIKSYAFPTSDDIVSNMHKACRAEGGRQVSNAVRTVIEAMDHKLAPDNLNQPWIEATALLCRTCQERGRVDSAANLLLRVIGQGPMEESAYFSHEPLALVELLVARAESRQPGSKAYAAILDDAINLFLPSFLERPTDTNPEIYRVGRKLLELCFAADRLQRIFSVYRRCNALAGENSNELTTWFITRLYEHQYYASVVRIFVSTFAQSSPTEESVRAIGDLVVDSVELAHHHMAAGVLATLKKLCAGFKKTKLSSRWAMKLLLSHWKKHGEFKAVEGVLGELRTPALEDVVHRAEDVYRVMVELALEAGEEEKADLYFHLASNLKKRDPVSDFRLRGVFAEFYAARDDWGAVRMEYTIMNKLPKPSDKIQAHIFVAVLQAYSEKHTIRETEVFLKSYADEFGVPLCGYTVTMMAKRYGALRDVQSLIDWLDYCSRAGFPVDASFTNVILVRCRREWALPFRDLRTLFRKLRLLNPDFIDHHGEQIMADAALSDSKYGGEAARGRLLSLRINPNKLPGQYRHARVDDIALAMKEALRTHQPRRALGIYKRAVFLNTPHTKHTLQLAVQAQLQLTPDDYDGAYQLIHAAQIKGKDTNLIVNFLLAQQLKQITATVISADEADLIVQKTLAAYRKAGVALTEASLHRASIVCLRAGYSRGAIRYALQAAETLRKPPCFSLTNFRILLAAYASIIDVEGLEDTIRRGMTHPYREHRACRNALRQARQQLGHSQLKVVLREDRAMGRKVVDDALSLIVQARKKLREDGQMLESAALGIMRAAARDMAGGEEVDFGLIPWLGGKKQGKSQKKKKKSGKNDGGGNEPVVGNDAFSELERTFWKDQSLLRDAAVEASF